MTTHDKSDQVGYDARDDALNAELEAMIARTPPAVVRRLQHRIHDTILQRMKEESTRRCFEFVKKLERCVNEAGPLRMNSCVPHREALNDCAAEVNREDTYQRYRIAYLTGELARLHDERLGARVETFKASAPDAMPHMRAPLSLKYAEHMEGAGVQPAGKIVVDDLAAGAAKGAGTH